MQGHYSFAFEREMGCTAEELRGWLPGACGGRSIEWRERGADIALDKGVARIDWRTLEPRRIALITVPRLQVAFDAQDIAMTEWQRFMRYFDLYTQRGGG